MEQSYRIGVGASEVVFSTGKLAKQSSAAVLGQHGETSVLVAVNMTPSPREGLDFFPLLVDYEERYYAAGKIPGGFIKREGRPSETAILSARCIDRSIRSLFPDHMRNDVHVVATVMTVDQKNPPEFWPSTPPPWPSCSRISPGEGPWGRCVWGSWTESSW